MGLGGTYIIEGLIHLGYDVKTVEDAECLGASFPDHMEIGLPHVGTDELDVGAEFGSEHGEEALEGFDGSLLADPEQASEVRVDLIDQGEVLVAFGILDLVHTDGRSRTGVRCAKPQSTTNCTAWQTVSHEVRNDSAVSVQDSLRAQRARKIM